jgi:hypothetical protein
MEQKSIQTNIQLATFTADSISRHIWQDVTCSRHGCFKIKEWLIL